MILRISMLSVFVRVPPLLISILIIIVFVRDIPFLVSSLAISSSSAVVAGVIVIIPLASLLGDLLILQKLLQSISLFCWFLPLFIFLSVFLLSNVLGSLFLLGNILCLGITFLLLCTLSFALIFGWYLLFLFLSNLWVFRLIFLFFLLFFKLYVFYLICFLIIFIWDQSLHSQLFLTLRVTWSWIHEKRPLVVIDQIIVFVLILNFESLLLFEIKLFIVVVISGLFRDQKLKFFFILGFVVHKLVRFFLLLFFYLLIVKVWILFNIIDIDILRHLRFCLYLSLPRVILINVVIFLGTILQCEFKVHKILHVELECFVFLFVHVQLL